MDASPIFETRDLILASTLVTLRFRVMNVTYQIEGRKNLPIGYFEFENSENLVKAIGDFNAGDLAVEPKQFMTNFKSLKSQTNSYYKAPSSDFTQLKRG